MFLRKKLTTRTTPAMAPKLTLEPLEDRMLLSVSVRDGVLTLLGKPRADTYIVSLSAPAADEIVVSENGRVRSFELAQVTGISANGGRGNDLIELDQGNGQILLPTTLVGGDGNDTVIGGGGADRIDGQAGDDLLRGQAGADVLVGGPGDDDADGGKGNDMLHGNDGDDVLTGGAGIDSIEGGLDDDLFDSAEVDAGEVQDNGVGTDQSEIAADDAPQAVQDAIAGLVGTGSLERLLRQRTGNTTTFEADYESGNLEHSAVLTETGAVLEQDLEVDPASLPPAVFDAALGAYARGSITRAEFTTSAAGELFEVAMEVRGREFHELTITTGGVILDDEMEIRNRSDKPEPFRDFTSFGTVPFFNLVPGAVLTLEGDDDGDFVRLVITLLDAIKMIDGVETRIVEERETVNGELVEVSRNFFVIDRQTNNLYYFGEDVDDYENGEIVDHEGAWRSGVNRAKFGLLIPGLPVVGLSHAQERAPGVALDTGQVVSTNETVVTPAGTFTGVLKVRETSPLDEPGAESFKYYAPGIGLIQDDSLQLVSSVIP